MEVKWSLRQNMNKCTKNQIDIVNNLKLIIYPWYHGNTTMENSINQEGNIILNHAPKYDKYFDEIQINDYCIIFGENKALLVQIDSNHYIRYLPEINIYSRLINEQFKVIKIQLANQNDNIQNIEIKKMWAIVRNVKIIREINHNETIYKKYYNFRGSLIKNRSNERFI